MGDSQFYYTGMLLQSETVCSDRRSIQMGIYYYTPPGGTALTDVPSHYRQNKIIVGGGGFTAKLI